MKDWLYIRFFVNKESCVPYDSFRLGHRTEIIDDLKFNMSVGIDSMEWMRRHPNGKVDFVWCTEAGLM